MICLAGINRGPDHGFVLIAGRAPTPAEIARQIHSTEAEVVALLAELESNKVFNRDRRKVIYCRRMVRAEKSRVNGRLSEGENERKSKADPSAKPLETIENKKQASTPEPEPEKKEGRKKIDRPERWREVGDDELPALRASRASAASRIPPDWKPSEADLQFASTVMDPRLIQAEADHFRDYWLSIPGAKSMKADWPATWRNWCRRAGKNSNGGGNGGARPFNGGGSDRHGGGDGFLSLAAKLAGRQPH